MKKDSIVQFVCFITNLEPADFIKKWEPVSRKLAADCESMLQESITGKAKYKYILQHEGSAVDFRLSFMKNRSRESSPEHRARLVHAGGYTPVQFQSLHSAIEDDVKVLAFIDHKETDVDLTFYHQQVYRYLNIYQAYYESCAYSYVLEFYIQQYDAPALIAQLKTRSGVEVSSYKESAVFHC
jgi:hypothetical protein